MACATAEYAVVVAAVPASAVVAREEAVGRALRLAYDAARHRFAPNPCSVFAAMAAAWCQYDGAPLVRVVPSPPAGVAEAVVDGQIDGVVLLQRDAVEDLVAETEAWSCGRRRPAQSFF